jgi:hypothetical protein
MMVGWKKGDYGVFILLRDEAQTERHRHGGTAVCGLDDFAPLANVRELIAKKNLVRPRKHEERSIFVEDGRYPLPRLVEKALSSEKQAELFGPRIARDAVGQFL